MLYRINNHILNLDKVQSIYLVPLGHSLYEYSMRFVLDDGTLYDTSFSSQEEINNAFDLISKELKVKDLV